MRVILTYILFLFSFNLVAQVTSVDSLKSELKITKNEQNRIELLFKIGKFYVTETPDSALLYFNRALSLSSEIEFQPGIAKSHLYIAKSYNSQKQYNKAILETILAEKVYNTITDIIGNAKCYYEKGVAFYRLGKNDSTFFYLDKALSIFDPNVNLPEIADAERIKSVCYWSMGNYAQGLVHINKAIEVYINAKDTSNLSTSLNTKGALLWGIANYKESLENYFEALYLLDENKEKPGRFIVLYNNIGMVYNDWGDYEAAFNYYQKAEKLIPISQHKIGIAYTYLNLGTYYLEFNNIQKALELLEKSKKGYAQENDINGVCLCKIRIGQCYIKQNNYTLSKSTLTDAISDAEISENKHRKSLALYQLARNEVQQKKYNEALIYALESFDLAQNGDYKDLLHVLAMQISEIYEKQEKLDLSVEMLKSALVFKDEIYKEKEAVQYQIIELNRQNEIKELENESLKNEIELRDKTILYIALTVGLVTLMLIMTLLFNRSLSKKQKELQKVNESKDKIFSIVAHDLRSPVGNLNSMIDIMVEDNTEYDYREILNAFKPIITKSYNMLENLLVWAKSNLGKLDYKGEKIPIHKTIKESIQLVSHVAAKKSISIVLHSENEIYVLADVVLLQTIIRNLLNNAIKFTNENGTVKISTEINKKQCIVSIKDNGIGIPVEKHDLLFKGEVHTLGTKNEKGSGIGIMLCKDLAEKNEGKLWFKSKEGLGSTFSFSIPLYNSENNQI